MKKLSVLFAATMMFMAVGIAKAQKIAYMDYQEVLGMMPETKKISSDLDTLSKAKEAELKKMGDAFQLEVQNYQNVEGPKMTGAQRDQKEAELRQKQESLQKVASTAQTDLVKKRDDLIKPVVDKLNMAIDKVAKANGWDYIVEAGVLIYRNGPDATPLVKKELGIQ